MTGDQLKLRRTALGWSQEKLARELDVSNASVARWEQFKEREIVASGMLVLAIETLERRETKNPRPQTNQG